MAVLLVTAGTVLERYQFVSTTAASTNADGSSNYQKDVVNRGSNYIRINNAQTSGNFALTNGAKGERTTANVNSAHRCV